MKKSIGDFVDFMDDLEYKVSKTQTAKGIKYNGAKLIKEIGEYLVYHITTPEAAKLYGRGTRWCITDTITFYQYSEGGGNFYFFIKKNSIEKIRGVSFRWYFLS